MADKDKRTDEEKAADEESERIDAVLKGEVKPGTGDLPAPEPRDDDESK